MPIAPQGGVKNTAPHKPIMPSATKSGGSPSGERSSGKRAGSQVGGNSNPLK